MTEKFQNKYRIKSTRLQDWDYGSNAAYFVTICTQNREHYFGEITNGIMQLSEIGYMANKYWSEIPKHFPFVELDEFVIMPNHVHGIIVINKSDNGKSNDERSPILNNDTTYKNKFGPQSKNLASIVRGFKIGVTINARKIHADFAWQSRFHDHIIRNDESFYKISDYIKNNPTKWTDDKFYE